MTRGLFALKAVLPALAASWALAGCVSLLPESEPVDFFRLTPPSPMAGAADNPESPTLMIGVPNAPRALGGDDILVARDDGALALAADAKWASAARNMMLDFLLETFEATDGAPTPLRPGDGLRGDYELSLDLRHFEAVYDRGMESAPLIKVALGARLIGPDRALVGTTMVSAERRASDNRMSAIVQAFDTASLDVAEQLIEWSGPRVEPVPPES